MDTQVKEAVEASAGSNEMLLSVRDVYAGYDESMILKGVSIDVPEKKAVALLGRNGTGKTTLLNTILGLVATKQGTINFTGEMVHRMAPDSRARLGIGYVPQGRDIFPLLTVRENLETGFACLPRSEHAVPDEIFELFPILKDFLHRRGGDLSGGQQQQLAIARALIAKPKLLLLDEPTEGIQPNIIQQIGRVIERLREKGEMAIVLVEQYFEFARDLADSFLVMDRGEVVMSGARENMVEADVRRYLTV